METDTMRNIPNLSRAASLMVAFRHAEEAAHDDVDAFCAPSECHALVNYGIERRERRVRRHVEGVTGWPYKLVVREIHARITAKSAYRLGL